MSDREVGSCGCVHGDRSAARAEEHRPRCKNFFYVF